MDQWQKCQAFLKNYNINPQNAALYLEALTHNSYAYENKLSYNYQRLEFLGDAVLSLAIAHYVYDKYNSEQEGMITDYRQKLIKGVTLSKVATLINLNKLILIGKGELKQNPRVRSSIQADVYEALLAAIYLDLGFVMVRHFINQTLIFQAKRNQWLTSEHDYKSRLQTFVQSRGSETLEYVTTTRDKQNDKWQFEVNVLLDKMICGTGSGDSIKAASQKAAENCLLKLAVKDVK